MAKTRTTDLLVHGEGSIYLLRPRTRGGDERSAPRVHRLLGSVDGVGGNEQHTGVRSVHQWRDGATPTAQRSRVIRL